MPVASLALSGFTIVQDGAALMEAESIAGAVVYFVITGVLLVLSIVAFSANGFFASFVCTLVALFTGLRGFNAIPPPIIEVPPQPKFEPPPKPPEPPEEKSIYV